MTWLMGVLKIQLEEQLFIKILRGKAFNITKNLKYNGYQRERASIVYNFFDEKLLLKQLKMKICQTKT